MQLDAFLGSRVMARRRSCAFARGEEVHPTNIEEAIDAVTVPSARRSLLYTGRPCGTVSSRTLTSLRVVLRTSVGDWCGDRNGHTNDTVTGWRMGRHL